MIPTETDVLAFWIEHTESMGFPPQRRQAAAAFDVPRAVIDRIVHRLHDAGLMEAGGTGHQSQRVSALGKRRVIEGASDPIPYLLAAAPAATLVIGEAKCECGDSHFRVGALRCFFCDTANGQRIKERAIK